MYVCARTLKGTNFLLKFEKKNCQEPFKNQKGCVFIIKVLYFLDENKNAHTTLPVYILYVYVM